MTCAVCADHGVFKIAYRDGSDTDYAICLCPVGEQWRRATNNGKPCTPQWQIWAHRQGISLDRVHPIEDVLTDEELGERGFKALTAESSMEAIAQAARSRPPRGR